MQAFGFASICHFSMDHAITITALVRICSTETDNHITNLKIAEATKCGTFYNSDSNCLNGFL